MELTKDFRRRLAFAVACVGAAPRDDSPPQASPSADVKGQALDNLSDGNRAFSYQEADERDDEKLETDVVHDDGANEQAYLSALYSHEDDSIADSASGTELRPEQSTRCIPLCSFTRPLGLIRGGKGKGVQSDQIFEAADLGSVSQRLKQWFPQHDVGGTPFSSQDTKGKGKETSKTVDAFCKIEPHDATVEPPSSPVQSKATPLSGKKRKRADAASSQTILLDAELVVDPYDTGSTNDGDEWLLCLVAFAPVHFVEQLQSGRRRSKQTHRDRLAHDEQAALFLGNLIFRRSSSSPHPYSALHPSLFARGWLQVTRCKVEFGAPFLTEVAASRGGKTSSAIPSQSDSNLSETSSPSHILNARVHVDLAMPETALTYGTRAGEDGCIETRKDYALAFRDLVARLVHFDRSAPSAFRTGDLLTPLIELDDQWPERDFWQGKVGTRSSFYRLPERSVLVEYDSDASDGSDEQAHNGNIHAEHDRSTSAAQSSSSEPRPRKKQLPTLSLSREGTLAAQQSQKIVPGEWLCHIYLELPRTEQLTALLKQADGVLSAHHAKELSAKGLSYHQLNQGSDEPLHISLTRPILLRAHEREGFVNEVKAVLKNEVCSSLSVALATFAHFVNDDSTRVFLALEVGQGHEQIRALTQALDSRLSKLFQAQKYYSEARFHSSYAYIESHEAGKSSKDALRPELTKAQINRSSKAAEDVAKNLNGSLSGASAVRIRQVCVRVGKQVVRWQPSAIGAALPVRSASDVLSESQKKGRPKDARTKRKARGDAGRQEPPPAASAGQTQCSSASTTKAAQAEQDNDECRLPLSSSLDSFLLAARPDPHSPQVSPPESLIKTTLYKFQQQALAWMIDRETNLTDLLGLPQPNWIRIKSNAAMPLSGAPTRNFVATEEEAHADEKPSLPSDEAPSKRRKASRAETLSESGQPGCQSRSKSPASSSTAPLAFFLDKVSGTPSLRSFHITLPRQSGGVLADAMGLGKTLEILSLVATNPRPSSGFADSSQSARLVSEMPVEQRPANTSATLIVAPAALMHQWNTEIHRHLCNAKVVQYTPEWLESETRQTVRSRISEQLDGAIICLVSYETLSSDYSRSEVATRQTRKGAISPLLEVVWHRIVLDEAQLFAAKSTGSSVSSMCGALWRSHSWVCSSTPLRQPKDLLPILSFLDYDVFCVRRIFNELVEGNLFRAKEDPEAARQIWSLAVKLFWRNERAHVADQLSLPPQSSTRLGVKARGLEAAIYTRESRTVRKEFLRLLGKIAPNFTRLRGSVANLRQLASHPSVASALGYSNADTFASFFTKSRNATRAAYMREVLDGCTLAVSLDTIIKALKHEEDSFVWSRNSRLSLSLFSESAVEEILHHWSALSESLIEMQVADKQLTRQEIDDFVEADGQPVNPVLDPRSIERHSSLTVREAHLSLQHAISAASMADFPARHRNRCVGLAFQREVFYADTVNANQVHRYHPLVGDAGFTEDEEWMREIMGVDYEDEKKRAAMERTIRAQGEGSNPVMKNRLRGKAEGHRTRERVWGWVPKRTLPSMMADLQAIRERCESTLRDLRWIENRMKEEGVHLDPSKTSADGSDQNTDKNSHGSSPSDCIICLETPIVVGLLPCLHSACYDCLCELAQKNNNICPYCRRSFAGVSEISEILPARDSSAGAEGYEVGEAEAEYGVKVATLAMEIMQRLKEDPSTKVVVFSLWRKMLNKVFEGLYKMGIDCAVFGGGSAAQTQALADFGGSGDKSVLLCPMKMSEGAAGLTLTMANVGYVMEPVLNANLLAQAKGRLNRIGQSRATEIVEMFVETSIEERILALADRRGNGAMGSGESSRGGNQSEQEHKREQAQVSEVEEDVFSVEELKFLFDVKESEIEGSVS